MDHLLTREQLDYREKVHTCFTEKLAPIADQLEKKNEFPMEFYKQLGRDGFLSINFPIEYEGKGLDSICSALLLERSSPDISRCGNNHFHNLVRTSYDLVNGNG